MWWIPLAMMAVSKVVGESQKSAAEKQGKNMQEMMERKGASTTGAITGPSTQAIEGQRAAKAQEKKMSDIVGAAPGQAETGVDAIAKAATTAGSPGAPVPTPASSNMPAVGQIPPQTGSYPSAASTAGAVGTIPPQTGTYGATGSLIGTGAAQDATMPGAMKSQAGGGGGAAGGATDYAGFAMQMMDMMRANADRKKALSQSMVQSNQAQSQQQVAMQEEKRRRMAELLRGGGGQYGR